MLKVKFVEVVLKMLVICSKSKWLKNKKKTLSDLELCVRFLVLQLPDLQKSKA